MRIFLTGYMFSGKTTIGKKLANYLDMEFYDLDEYFEKKYKLSILQFFEKYNEELFRKLETEALHKLVEEKDDIVISTGGGTACFNNNMTFMNTHGVTVYVRMDYRSVISRMKTSKKKRPLLMHIPPEKLDAFVQDHLDERKRFYEQSKIAIKGENAEITEIVRLIRQQI